MDDLLNVQADGRLAAHLRETPAPHIMEEDAEPNEDLLEIGNPSKEWVLYHNLQRVGLEVIQVEHGDYFALFDKVPKNTRPSSLDKATSGPASESIRNADQKPPAWPVMANKTKSVLMHPPPAIVFRTLMKNVPKFSSDTWLTTI